MQVLYDNDSIAFLSDYYITPGYPSDSQDTKLQDTHQTATWIREISKTETAFIGSANSGEYLYDKIIQVDVFSRHSQQSAYELASDIEKLLKATASKAFNGSIYKFGISLQSRTSMFNDEIDAWQEMIRFRVQGLYS